MIEGDDDERISVGQIKPGDRLECKGNGPGTENSPPVRFILPYAVDDAVVNRQNEI